MDISAYSMFKNMINHIEINKMKNANNTAKASGNDEEAEITFKFSEHFKIASSDESVEPQHCQLSVTFAELLEHVCEEY